MGQEPCELLRSSFPAESRSGVSQVGVEDSASRKCRVRVLPRFCCVPGTAEMRSACVISLHLLRRWWEHLFGRWDLEQLSDALKLLQVINTHTHRKRAKQKFKLMLIWPEAHSLFTHVLSGEVGLGGVRYECERQVRYSFLGQLHGNKMEAMWWELVF